MPVIIHKIQKKKRVNHRQKKKCNSSIRKNSSHCHKKWKPSTKNNFAREVISLKKKMLVIGQRWELIVQKNISQHSKNASHNPQNPKKKVQIIAKKKKNANHQSEKIQVIATRNESHQQKTILHEKSFHSKKKKKC